MNYGIIINNLAVIFGMIAVGFAAGKAHLLSERASADFTSFMMKIALPCMIFMSLAREFDARLLRESILGVVLCFCMILLTLWVTWFLAGILKIAEWRRATWIFSSTFGNSGFMGFPLIRAIFGADGLLLASVMGMAHLMIQYTLCVRMFCHYSGRKDAEQISWKGILLSNPNIALGLGLIFFIFQIPLPETAATIINSFGNITTPLSMFLIGMSLADGKLSEAFRDFGVVSCTAMRLIVVPLLFVVILRLLPVPSELLPGVLLLAFAMPCPSLGMVFSQQYGGDVKLGAQSIFLSSLCCIVTVPLVMLLL